MGAPLPQARVLAFGGPRPTPPLAAPSILGTLLPTKAEAAAANKSEHLEGMEPAPMPVLSLTSWRQPLPVLMSVYTLRREQN